MSFYQSMNAVLIASARYQQAQDFANSVVVPEFYQSWQHYEDVRQEVVRNRLVHQAAWTRATFDSRLERQLEEYMREATTQQRERSPSYSPEDIPEENIKSEGSPPVPDITHFDPEFYKRSARARRNKVSSLRNQGCRFTVDTTLFPQRAEEISRKRKLDVAYLAAMEQAEVEISRKRIKEDVELSTMLQRSSQSGTRKTRKRNLQRRKPDIMQGKEDISLSNAMIMSFDKLCDFYKHFEILTGPEFMQKPFMAWDSARAWTHDKTIFAPRDPHLMAFLEENPLPGFDPYKTCFINANTFIMHWHLQHFSRPACHNPPEKYKHTLGRATNYIMKRMRLPQKVNYPAKGDLQNAPYKQIRAPGWEYKRQGFSTRKEAFPTALKDAIVAYDEMSKGHSVAAHVLTLGGRGKMVMMSEDEAVEKQPLKGRMMLMTSTRDHILMSQVILALNNAYAAGGFPVSIGSSFFYRGADSLVKRVLEHDYYHCNDARKYDSSLPAWALEWGVDVLLSNIHFESEHFRSAFRAFVLDGLVYSRILLPEGVFVKKEGGSASGHNFNSLVQSIITAMLCYFSFMHFNPDVPESVMEEVFQAEGFGDDNFALWKFAHIDREGREWVIKVPTKMEQADVVEEATQVDWHGDKSIEGYTDEAVVDKMQNTIAWDEMFSNKFQYLGKQFRKDDELHLDTKREVAFLPLRPMMESVSRLLYQEGRIGDLYFAGWDDVNLTAARLYGNMLDNYVNRAFRSWATSFNSFLCDREGYAAEKVPLIEKSSRFLELTGEGITLRALCLRPASHEEMGRLLLGRKGETLTEDINKELEEMLYWQMDKEDFNKIKDVLPSSMKKKRMEQKELLVEEEKRLEGMLDFVFS